MQATKDLRDKKALDFALRLHKSGYLDTDKYIIIDKNGDCHECDKSLATIKYLTERQDQAKYAIRLDFENNIHLFRIY